MKRRPPSDSAGQAGRGDTCFHADRPSVLLLRGAAVLACSNDRRAITRERKGVERSNPHDCVRLAQTYAAMSSLRRYDAFFFEISIQNGVTAVTPNTVLKAKVRNTNLRTARL